MTKTFVIKAETVKNLYENRDDRRDEYFYKLDSMSHDTMYKVNQGYAYVYKWREVVYENVSWSPTPQVAYVDANYSYWRLADIYLLRAECYAKLNDDLAKADLNKIRDRANATPILPRERVIFNWQSLKNESENCCLKGIDISILYGTGWNISILIWMVITRHWISRM